MFGHKGDFSKDLAKNAIEINFPSFRVMQQRNDLFQDTLEHFKTTQFI
jgi:hypothetical protein